MKKGRKIIAAVSVFTLLMGMQVNAAENEVQTYSLPGYASLSIGGVQIVSWGEITGEMPENVSYDAQANVLTLDNYISAPDADSDVGISCYGMGEDFVIRLEGENSITVSSDNYYEIIRGDYLNFEGTGSLDLLNVPMLGISYSNGLTIDGCTINITGNQSGETMFYGITGSYTIETEAVIKNSEINISNSKPSESTAANAGIDVQAGNLTIQNSEVKINLTNGNIFGLAAGYKQNSDSILGGDIDISSSTVRCITATNMLGEGNRYNHNMYFYEMKNADQLHYYASNEDSFVEKSFDEIFTHKFSSYPGRYDSDTSTVISSTPLAEYCSHEWDEGKVTKEATCEEAGEMTYTCALCGEEKTEEIATLGHTWSEWDEIKAATCTEDGARMRTCSRCNETETEVIAKLGHDYVETIVKEPTCTENGLKNQECSRCHDTTENVVIPATGHDYEWVVTKEPTFHEDGVKTGTCRNCNDVKIDRIPKLSESHTHNYTGREEIIKEATCTEEGSKRIYCTEPECGEYITESIPMTEHTPGEWTTVKEATCSENGSEQRVCTVCGAVIETRVTDMLPHTYGEWTVTLEPTCTEAGVETAECEVCGETTVRGINPLGHDYAEWTVTKEATCTEDGEETSECTRCGEISTRAIEAKGHSFGEWKIEKEATETENGERQAVCTECGEVKSEVIPKLSETQPTVPNGNDGANNSGNQSADKNSNVPATGDETPILPAVMALVVSAGAVVIIRKRRVAK